MLLSERRAERTAGEDWSGKSLDRPSMQKALEILRGEKAEGIVVSKLDRLTRNVGDLSRLIEEMRESSCDPPPPSWVGTLARHCHQLSMIAARQAYSKKRWAGSAIGSGSTPGRPGQKRDSPAGRAPGRRSSVALSTFCDTCGARSRNERRKVEA